jgi:hypothetical protein
MQLIPSLPTLGTDDTGVPLVPEAALRKAHALVPGDTRFKSAARFLASNWRKERDIPIGTIRHEGRKQKLGSMISEPAGWTGHNFASPVIRDLAARELIFRQRAAMYDSDRLRNNLLSSQTMCFNLLGPLAADPKLATRVARDLFPGILSTVTAVRFEYAPVRGDERFGGDYTAWDALLLGRTPSGGRGFIAIEIKFTESCDEGGSKPISSAFQSMLAQSVLFANHEDAGLGAPQHRQFLREHLMAQSVVDLGMADAGAFAVIAPLGNHLARKAAEGYAVTLNEPEGAAVPFIYRPTEAVLEALAANRHEHYAQELYSRYLDFGRVAADLGFPAIPRTRADTVAPSLPA